MFANFIEESCTGIGNTMALDVATFGRIKFTEAFNNGDDVAYVIVDSGGVIVVGGVGTYVSATDDITRNDTWNWNGATIDNSPATNIALSGGTHVIRCDVIASSIIKMHDVADAIDASLATGFAMSIDAVQDVYFNAHVHMQTTKHLYFGAGEISSDGTGTYLQRQASVGGIHIEDRTPSGNVYLEAFNSSNNSRVCLAAGGATPHVKLYYAETIGIQLRTTAIGVDINYGQAAVDAAAKIGAGRTGNGNSYLDLIGDATYTDYGLRVIRDNVGPNGNSQLLHRGTGALELKVAEAGSIKLYTSSTLALTLDSAQDAAFTGHIRQLDTMKSYYGTDDDLSITHNGADAYLINNTGDFNIHSKLNSGLVIIETDNSVGVLNTVAEFGGATPSVKLFKGDVEVMQTIADGIQITDGTYSPSLITGISRLILNDGDNYITKINRSNSNSATHVLEIYSDVTAAGTNHLKIYCDGDIENTNGTYATLSDERIKSNIKLIDNSKHWDKGLNIEWKEFDKINASKRLMGVIAQEIELIYPSVIKEVEEHDFDFDGAVKSVAISTLTQLGHSPMMQLVQQKITALEERIKLLEAA